MTKIRKNYAIEIVPICQGCLGKPCSFCKTKEARGELFSYDVEDIKNHITKAVKDHVKEIWLTAQDTGAYGKDKGSSLIILLDEILKINGDFKVRLGMLNPNHFKGMIDELLKIYKDKKMFKFIHIPVQSGNDRILKLMNREYSVEDFKKIIAKIKKGIPEMTIATDMICGFPTETEEEFKDSIRLIKEIAPDVVNISRYSARPNTIAARMKQLPGGIIKDRSTEMSKVFKDISYGKNKRWIGKECEIILDEYIDETRTGGRNDSYKPMIINKKLSLGTKINVKIKDASIFNLCA